MKKYLTFLVVMILTITCLFSGTNTYRVLAQTMPRLKVESAMVVENINGQILYADEIEDLVEVGELSKVLILYLAAEAIEDGTISASDNVVISEKAYDLSQDYNLHNVPLRQDFEYQVSELMEAIAMTGANGTTLALAEHIAGDENKAVQLMKKTLDQWGFDYDIVNVTGLPHKLIPHQKETYEDGKVNKMTAEACATVTYHLIQKYPEIIENAKQDTAILKKESDDPYEMSNAVAMISNDDYKYSGTTGLMIGTSKNSGDSVIITAQRNGLPVISVLLGTEKRGQGQRYHDSKKLLDYIYSTYIMQDILNKDQKVNEIGQVYVKDGKSNNVNLVYSDAYQMAMPISGTTPRVTFEFVPDEKLVNEQGFIQAPIEKETVIGQVALNIDKKKTMYIKGGDGNLVDIQTSEAVEEAPWYQKAWNNTTQAVKDSWEATRVFFTHLFN